MALGQREPRLADPVHQCTNGPLHLFLASQLDRRCQLALVLLLEGQPDRVVRLHIADIDDLYAPLQHTVIQGGTAPSAEEWSSSGPSQGKPTPTVSDIPR